MKKEDVNVNLIDAQFKDDSPVKTVERIKGILSSHGIKTTERWSESGIEHCFSLRVSVDGTRFGTNGKGLTKEFALASGYGELIERMQLRLFGDTSVQKLGYFNYSNGAGEKMSAEKLYDEIPEWYEFLAERVNDIDGKHLSGREILSRFSETDGMIDAVRFYDLMTGKSILIPKNLLCMVCGSNGGAAGNTPEEAIVQALSEIVERHYKQAILSERIALPEIPEEVLKKYETAYKIIESVRQKGIRVIVKDCSLGKKFPVVCVYYINEKSGRYHTHFGAYPIFEIALERALTESFQGRNIDGFTKNEDFIYGKKDAFTYKNVYAELKKGDYIKTPEFFVGECKYEYNANVGFKGKNNGELLSEMIEFFKDAGYRLLVRDASALGFPTYSILIPGYSEIIFHSLSEKYFSNFSHSEKAIGALRNLNKAELYDLPLLLLHIDVMKKMGMVGSNIFSFANCANLILDCSKEEDVYLTAASLAFVHYSMGDLPGSVAQLEKFYQLVGDEDAEYLLCLKRYLSMRASGYDEATAKKLVSFFHGEKTVSKLCGYVDNGKNPFEDFVLRCDLSSCEECRVAHCCKQKYTMELIDLVNEKAKMLNFDDLAEHMKKYTLA